LFAGRPGRVETLRSIEELCDPRPAPVAVAVSSAGLVTYEASSLCSPRPPKALLLLRSFAGHRLRRLDGFQSTEEVSSLAAAGHWAAWLEDTSKGGALRIIDLRSGSQILTQAVPQTARTVAIDAQGNFAIASRGSFDGCPPDRRRRAEIALASIAHPRLRTIVRRAASADLALFRGTVAFAAMPEGCALSFGPALFRGRLPVIRFPALPRSSGLNGIAYDGRALAIGDGHRILLRTLGASR
jgi:hypothetical protein